MMHWNKSRRSDHPMADRRHAMEFLNRLPQDDPFRLLEEISFWLKALRDAYGLVPRRVLDAVELFDVTAYPHRNKLVEYFIALGGRYQNYQAQRAWNTSSQFARELGAAYRLLIEQYRKGVTGFEQLKPMLPIISARAMRALECELKWNLLRRGQLDETLWSIAGEMYAYAEDGGFATQSVTLYQGEQADSNIQREYLRALMLSISSADSLPPEKVQLAESFIRHYTDFFALERSPRRGCHYYVDLKAGRAPARLVARIASNLAVRYFGPDQAAASVASMIERVRQRDAAPAELDLGGAFDAQTVLEVLEHLTRYWDLNPPTRASERKPALMRIDVVHDFGSIMSMVSGDTQELDFSSAIETWTVEDESEGGFGAVVTEGTSDWLEIGSLLGIRLEEGASWGVGVVRRLSRPASGRMFVGIQTLSKGAVRVDVSATSDHRSNDALLLLSDSEGSAQTPELALMLPTGTFDAAKKFVVRTFGRTYPVMPKQVFEKGAGYECARFRLQQAEATDSA
jgi:cyclic-di-GMP-binding protein